MNCLIYLRVSTKEQAEEGHSIPAQKEACLKYIQDKGWKFVDMYVDRGESARSAHRPQLQEMLSRIKKDKSINIVVVHKIDRLARNMEDHVAIKAILKRQEVSLVSVVENIEDSASGRLIEGIHALMAEFYSANLAMETKKGQLQMVKSGGWPGLAPVGYKNIRDERGKALIVPNPEVAPLVKEAFNLYATGEYTTFRLHRMIASKGLMTNSTKKPICHSKFIEMLKSKFYVGIITWKEVEYQGKHKPVILKSTFARVQEVLLLHDKSGERVIKHPHYLRGTLYCGYCGARLSSSLAKGKYLYFYCLGKKRGNSYLQSHIFIDSIEDQIMNLYKKIQLPQEKVEELTARLEKELIDKESFNIKQREFITKRMARLNNEREKLLQAFYVNAIPVELLKKEQTRIGEEMAKLESVQEQVTGHLDQVNRSIEMGIGLASNCYSVYQKASPNNKRKFNHALFEKIYLKDKIISKCEYSEFFKDLFSDKETNSSSNNTLVAVAGLEPATPRV